MTWLIGQLWFLLLIAFTVGALIAYLIVTLLLPKAADLEAEHHTTSKGVLR